MIDSIINMIKPIAIPISWTLIHSLWQGLIIAGVLALALFTFRSAGSRFRYVLALGALVTIMMSSLSTYYYITAENQYTEQINSTSLTPTTTASALIGLEESVVSVALAVNNSALSSNNNYSALIWLFIFWVIGVLTLTIYNFISWQWTRYFATTLIHPISESWQLRFENLCIKLEMSKKIQLIESKLIQSPCVIGWIKPLILVPSGIFTGFNTQYLEMILTHELAHIKNNDILLNYFQKFIETLFFFNPPVWWVSRKIRLEREHCCDDLVIATYGDRLKYAHALTDLEQFRQDNFGFAMAASGGSLLNRIKRLVGKTDRTNYRSGIGAVLITVFSIVLIISAFIFTGGNSDVAVAQSSDIQQISFPPEKFTSKGIWDMAWYGERVEMKINFRQNGGHTLKLWYDELIGLEKKNNIKCTLVRDAGAIYFYGTLDKIGNECLGSGNCWFVADTGFFTELSKLGYHNSDGLFDFHSEKDQLNLALSDLSLEYARQIKQLGHNELSINDLIKLNSHDVTIEYIAELEKVGYSKLTAKQLLKMKDHGVDAYYIYTLQNNGYKKIQVDELIRCKDHGVDARFIESLVSSGKNDLTLKEIIKMKDHGVSSKYNKTLSSEGYEDLTSQELIKLRDHGVSSKYIKSLNKLGYSDLTTKELVKLSDHGVSSEYIKTLKAMDYDDLTVEELVKLRDHGVSSEYIKNITELGYDDFSAQDFVKLRNHSVSSDYIKTITKLDYDDFSAQDFVKLRDHSVSSKYIKAMKALGYDDLTVKELINLHNYDVNTPFISELATVGYKDIEPETIIEMKNYGVDADYINEVNEEYGKQLSPKKLLDIKKYGY